MALQVEFQAVVLAAGKGSRMPEITAGKAKCLLPVGTKPLVWYPLHQLQDSGFTEVILIVLEHQKSEVQSVLERTELEIKIDYVSIDGKEDLGTADSLRLISDRLKSDVLVLTCDIITDITLKPVLDLFRMHDASITSLLFHPQSAESTVVPGPKSKHKPERDLIGLDTQTNRLIFQASASDFEEKFTLPYSLLKKHTALNIYSQLVDAHVYVLKSWVIKYLTQQLKFTTIKGELLPHIVKKQLTKTPKMIEGKSLISRVDNNEEIFNYAQEDAVNLSIRDKSAYNDHTGDLKPAYHGDRIRCYAYLAPKESFGIRVNTLVDYLKANSRISEKWSKVTNDSKLIRIHENVDNKSSQVDENCVLWEGVKLHEKTAFKNATIGPNSEVRSFSRVFNSIVMNNVTIKEKVALENCIVCDGAVIESGCKIKSCLIGSNHKVEENSEHSQEVLTDADRLMEF